MYELVECFILVQDTFQFPLHEHDRKLQIESHVVAAVQTVPEGQEQERDGLAGVAIPQEGHPFVDILRHPRIGVQVETLNVVSKLGHTLKYAQFNVSAAIPLSNFVFAGSIVRNSKSDASACNKKC